MASVTLDHVCKEFDGAKVVRDVSLEIRDREFLVLVGPSGCGKSTILRMIAGLEAVTDGDIYIGERVVNDVSAKDRDIAMVFQNYALYPHMSVFDNMAFGLKLRRLAEEKINSRVNQTAEVLAIRDLLQRRPKQLSGGQRQRVALGRAIVREPQVFLMDEPLSNLDAKLRVQTRVELTKLHARLRTTVIYVSHDQVEAMTLGNRIAVLRDGVLQQVGAPADVYAKPANAFVAGFIGSPAMNFFKARLERSQDSVRVKGDGMEFDLPPEIVARIGNHSSADVILGVRPEDIHAAGAPASTGGASSIRAKIEVVEHMGNEDFIHLTCGSSSFMTRTSELANPKPGDMLSVTIAASKAHLFDAVTEMTIS